MLVGEKIITTDELENLCIGNKNQKDVWELKNLDIKIRSNPIYNVKTLDFRKIYQPDIREECKKAVYMNLQYEAIGTVQGEFTITSIFSEYLQKEYSKIKSSS